MLSFSINVRSREKVGGQEDSLKQKMKVAAKKNAYSSGSNFDGRMKMRVRGAKEKQHNVHGQFVEVPNVIKENELRNGDVEKALVGKVVIPKMDTKVFVSRPRKPDFPQNRIAVNSVTSSNNLLEEPQVKSTFEDMEELISFLFVMVSLFGVLFWGVLRSTKDAPSFI